MDFLSAGTKKVAAVESWPLSEARRIHLYLCPNSGKDDKNAAENRSKAERFAEHLCYVDDI